MHKYETLFLNRCFSLPLPKILRMVGGVKKESRVRLHIRACASGGKIGRGKSCGFGAFLKLALKVGFPVRFFFMQGRSSSPMINLAFE